MGQGLCGAARKPAEFRRTYTDPGGRPRPEKETHGRRSVGHAFLPGDSCKVHREPGQSDCFNLTTGTELENQASWCADPFCYIDKCNCVAEFFESVYFPGGTLYYSYVACGAADQWTTDDMNNDGSTDGCDVTTGGATRASAVGPALVASLAGLLAYAAL